MKYVALILILMFALGCQKPEDRNARALQVAEVLMRAALAGDDLSQAEPGVYGVVTVGDGLVGKLRELSSNASDDCTYALLDDSDPMASHVVMVACDEKPLIGLRLNYDETYDAFHILGWWTSGL